MISGLEILPAMNLPTSLYAKRGSMNTSSSALPPQWIRFQYCLYMHFFYRKDFSAALKFPSTWLRLFDYTWVVYYPQVSQKPIISQWITNGCCGRRKKDSSPPLPTLTLALCPVRNHSLSLPSPTYYSSYHPSIYFHMSIHYLFIYLCIHLDLSI